MHPKREIVIIGSINVLPNPLKVSSDMQHQADMAEGLMLYPTVDL